jgi:hypothetical protein
VPEASSVSDWRISRFVVLWRIFVAQFFASESATSDHQVRQAIIGVFAFLITPGFLVPLQLSGPFEFAAIRFPAMLDPLTRLMATIFITYGIISIGVIAAFAWDALGFDRRDAMVLGPLPVRGGTVIAAKLAALAALLLSGAAVINLLTAVTFAMVASNHSGTFAVARHFAAHLAATMSAATFVFCVLVTIRALLGLFRGGRVALASLVQFALVAALLCFIVLTPSALDIRRGRRGVATVHLQEIPAWSPTNWFLGLYETLRGSNVQQFGPGAVMAIEVTLVSIAVAILATVLSYRRQMQLALTPSGSAGSHVATRVQCALARALAGRDRVAQATADFVLRTILRNRVQQAPVAINTAIGVAIAAAGLSQAGGGLSALMRPRTIVLWIPMLLGYWMTIGVRASFFVPSELPASWMFRSNAPATSRGYWSGTRAAMMAFIVPPVTLLAAGLTAPLLGWGVAAWHVSFVVLTQLVLIELVTMTIGCIPFTQPYRPGHAKLKTLWPVYVLGMVVFARMPARFELAALGGDELPLIAGAAGAAIVMHVAARWRGAKWSVEPGEELADDLGDIAVLDIGSVVHHAHIGR